MDVLSFLDTKPDGPSRKVALRQLLNLLQFCGTDSLGMAEIKTQPIRRYQRAFLGHMIAQRLTQGFMQQMGGAVIGPQAVTAGRIHAQQDWLADRQLPLYHFSMMEKQASCLGGIGDAGASVRPAHLSGISDLAA